MSRATISIAVCVEVASAPIPAIRAPRTKPKSRQKRYTPTTRARSRGWLASGERVLDLGSGAGTDSLVAAQMVGEHGHVTGIDMTPEMLAKARVAAAEMSAANVEFVESEAEQ
ncbi:MAG TPA: methyltransferase domain-containing protein, partial [Gaiellaceae bacterium]